MLSPDTLVPNHVAASYWLLAHHDTSGVPLISERLIDLGIAAAALAQLFYPEPGDPGTGEGPPVHAYLASNQRLAYLLNRPRPPQDTISQWVAESLLNTSVNLPPQTWIQALAENGAATSITARWLLKYGHAKERKINRRESRVVPVTSVVAATPAMRLNHEIGGRLYGVPATHHIGAPVYNTATVMLGAIACATGLPKIVAREMDFPPSFGRDLHERAQTHLQRDWPDLYTIYTDLVTVIQHQSTFAWRR